MIPAENAGAPAEAKAAEDKPAEGSDRPSGEVVRLDRFRKK
jgi:hypothetical protein